jgi:hypothetical protein
LFLPLPIWLVSQVPLRPGVAAWEVLTKALSLLLLR